MTSARRGDSGKPPTPDQEKPLLELMESRHEGSPQLSKPDPAERYLQLLSDEELVPQGVWYRPGNPPPHGFVLCLGRPTMETRHKAYRVEVNLQGEFPLESFDFQFIFSVPLSKKARADLEARGYKPLGRPSSDAVSR